MIIINYSLFKEYVLVVKGSDLWHTSSGCMFWFSLWLLLSDVTLENANHKSYLKTSSFRYIFMILWRYIKHFHWSFNFFFIFYSEQNLAVLWLHSLILITLSTIIMRLMVFKSYMLCLEHNFIYSRAKSILSKFNGKSMQAWPNTFFPHFSSMYPL